MLLGGLFHRDSIYTHTFRRRLKKILPDARVATVDQPPEMGAAWLAAELHEHPIGWQKKSAERLDDLAAAMTEQRNARSENLEQMNPRELGASSLSMKKNLSTKRCRKRPMIWRERSRSSRKQCAKAAVCFTWARARAAGSACSMRVRFRQRSALRRSWCRESWLAV